MGLGSVCFESFDWDQFRLIKPNLEGGEEGGGGMVLRSLTLGFLRLVSTQL